MANLLLLLDRFPYVRKAVFRMLASEPVIFSRLLDLHAQGAR
jgi:hypothetical protein